MPLLTSIHGDGATGYYSIIVTRCEDGYEGLNDLEGKVLAFADPDSTSGYAVPYFNLVQQGYEPTTHFEATPFSGSHEAGVQAVANGTFDAAATYQDNPEDGIYQRMVDKGMLEEGVICPIWESPEITSGPLTARANLPQGLIDAMTEAMMAFPEADQEGFRQIIGWTEDDPLARGRLHPRGPRPLPVDRGHARLAARPAARLRRRAGPVPRTLRPARPAARSPSAPRLAMGAAAPRPPSRGPAATCNPTRIRADRRPA